MTAVTCRTEMPRAVNKRMLTKMDTEENKNGLKYTHTDCKWDDTAILMPIHHYKNV